MYEGVPVFTIDTGTGWGHTYVDMGTGLPIST